MKNIFCKKKKEDPKTLLLKSIYSAEIRASIDRHPISASGSSAIAASSYVHGGAKTCGSGSVAASSGPFSVSVAKGIRSVAIATGLTSEAYAMSYGSVAVSTSGNSRVFAKEKDSIAVAFGGHSFAGGVKGSWLLLTEYAKGLTSLPAIKNIRLVYVDGKEIEQNTLYKLKDGDVVKYDEEDEKSDNFIGLNNDDFHGYDKEDFIKKDV